MESDETVRDHDVTTIRVTSHMAAVADPFIRWLAEELSLDWVEGPWPDRLSKMSSGEVEFGWVCGLLHACRLASVDWPFAAVAAPVMTSDRHGGKPQYFGDVVVSERSEARSLQDLEGTVFAYNEPTSLSGYGMLLDRLGSVDQFERTVESGSHAESIALVRSGAADVAVVDSTVMDMMEVRGSDGVDAIRIIESLGPYPMPPIVASRSVNPGMLAEIREHLLTLHLDESGRAALGKWGVARFEGAADGAYRGLASACEQVL